MHNELQYLQRSIAAFNPKLEALRLCRHDVRSKDSPAVREHASHVIQEVEVTAKDIAFRLNILRDGEDKKRLQEEFARLELRREQGVRLLRAEMQKPLKVSSTMNSAALLDEEESRHRTGQLPATGQLQAQRLNPTTYLRQLRRLLAEDLEALVELQAMFNATLQEQGDQLNVVEGNLGDANTNATRGNQQLFRAVKSQAFRQRRKVALAAAVLGFCVGGPLGAAVGGSVAAAVVSAGAVALAGGTATACTINSYQRARIRRLERKNPDGPFISAPALPSPPGPSSMASSATSPLTPKTSLLKPATALGSFADAADLMGAPGPSAFQASQPRRLDAEDANRAPPRTTPAQAAATLEASVADGSAELFGQREQLERCRAAVQHFHQQMEYSELLLRQLGVSAAGVAKPKPAPGSRPEGSHPAATGPHGNSSSNGLGGRPASTAPGGPAHARTFSSSSTSSLTDTRPASPIVPNEQRSEQLQERDQLYQQAAAELDAIYDRLLVAQGEEKRHLNLVMCEAMKEISDIEGVLQGIHTQAKVINAELGEQNDILDDLEGSVDAAVQQNQAANSWIAKLLGR